MAHGVGRRAHRRGRRRDVGQHDLPHLCVIVLELLLQDLARLRDAGRTVRLVCRCAESRTRIAGARLLLQLLRLPQLLRGLRLRSGHRAHAHERECEQEDLHLPGLFYFALNPDSEDTGGILKKDWTTPEHEKLAALATAKGDPYATALPPAPYNQPPPPARPRRV